MKDLVLVIRSSNIEKAETDLLRLYGHVGKSMEKGNGEYPYERLFTFYDVSNLDIMLIRGWVGSRFTSNCTPPLYTLDGADISIEEKAQNKEINTHAR